MNVIKSKTITSLPILNKSKNDILLKVMNNNMKVKNNLSKGFNDNKLYQDLLFENKKLTHIYKEFNNQYWLAWETQKFVNDDLLKKEIERLDRRIRTFKPKVFEKVEGKYKRKNSKLTKLISKMIMLNYYSFRLEPTDKIILSLSKEIENQLEKYSPKLQARINKSIDFLISCIKYGKKPINYTTGTLFRTNQKELGIKPRLIYDHTNTQYNYFYCFDYKDWEDNFKKKTINIPLAYNEKYHDNLYNYGQVLSNSKKKNMLKNRTKKKKEISFFDRFLKINNIKNIESILQKEHCISLTKNTNRLKITLTYEDTFTPSKKNKTIGIDVGGGIHNSLATSENQLIGFKHLNKLVKKINKVDKLPDNNSIEKKEKGKKLAKVLRENTYNINKEISSFLKYCETHNISDIVMEDLGVLTFSNKKKNIRNKELNEKHNRVFRLIRSSGLVELFRKQARNKGIRIHIIPSYYTSKWCRNCGHIEDLNRQGKHFKCKKCNHSADSDINAANNILDIFGRFPKVLCDSNTYGELSAKKYLKKSYVKELLLSIIGCSTN